MPLSPHLACHGYGKGAGIFALMVWLLLLPVAGFSGDEIVPEIIAGTNRVDAEKLIELESRSNLVIIDSRLLVDRRQGYIEGSVNLTDTVTDCDSLAAVAPDVKAPILFYCNGPRCPRSARAAGIAQACGYRKVYWLRGGFEEWKQKKYPYIKK
ncbi:MAG: rhodanese-like domain-containing protein [Gammaproteobacteria bacterium]|nr:rhodanese-like domain-containing protein [Gammaproteobacteria bacterium]